MKTDFMPKTRSGKWSVWLNVFFVIVVVTSVSLVKVLGVLSFDNHWWDVTVGILALTTIIAFILGIIATIKKERSVLVYISVIIGLLATLFLFLHSLFIND